MNRLGFGPLHGRFPRRAFFLPRSLSRLPPPPPSPPAPPSHHAQRPPPPTSPLALSRPHFRAIYRSIASKTPPPSPSLGDLGRRSYHQWDDSSRPPNHFALGRLIKYVVIGANVAVFAAWSRPELRPGMGNHFTLSLDNWDEGRWWTVVTSTMSHVNPLHLGVNMLVFSQFADMCFLIGLRPVAHFLPLVGGSAVVSSLAYLWHSRRLRDDHDGRGGGQARTRALGASGVNNAMVTAVALMRPFVPMMFGLTLWKTVAIYLALDTFLLDRNTGIGHASHLGGSAFGMVFYLFVRRRFGGVF